MHQGNRWELSRLRILLVAALVILALAAASACTEEIAEPAGRVFFKEPQHRAQRQSPFQVEMGSYDVSVEPAGEVREGYGHFHIILRRGENAGSFEATGDLPPLGQPIAEDATHIHFDEGETEATLDLESGRHFITLMFADGNHVPYDPDISKEIIVDVVIQ